MPSIGRLFMVLLVVFVATGCSTPRPYYVTAPYPETLAKSPGELCQLQADFQLWLNTNQCNQAWLEDEGWALWACVNVKRFSDRQSTEEEDKAKMLQEAIGPWMKQNNAVMISHPVLMMSSRYPWRFLVVKVEMPKSKANIDY